MNPFISYHLATSNNLPAQACKGAGGQGGRGDSNCESVLFSPALFSSAPELSQQIDVLTKPYCLPPYSQKLQEYWLAENGLFLRSHRRELEVCLQIALTQVAGLQPIEPYLRLTVPKVPYQIIADIINAASIHPEQEILFYLGVKNNLWWCHTPLQAADSTQVASLESSLSQSYTEALVEIHSHGNLVAYPSSTDNEEERGKFRVFAIIGTLDATPTIYTRIGIYNHFFPIDSNLIFEIPAHIICLN